MATAAWVRPPGHPDPAGGQNCTLISIAVPDLLARTGSLLVSGMALAFLLHGWSLPLDLVALETVLLSQLWVFERLLVVEQAGPPSQVAEMELLKDP